MIQHPVRLRTIDSQEIEFDCAAGQWALDAAAGAGYTLPSLCSKGTCGGCFARVAEGDYEDRSSAGLIDEYEPAA